MHLFIWPPRGVSGTLGSAMARARARAWLVSWSVTDRSDHLLLGRAGRGEDRKRGTHMINAGWPFYGCAGPVLSNFKTNDFVTASALSPFWERRRYPPTQAETEPWMRPCNLHVACRICRDHATRAPVFPSCQVSFGPPYRGLQWEAEIKSLNICFQMN